MKSSFKEKNELNDSQKETPSLIDIKPVDTEMESEKESVQKKKVKW